MKITKAFTTQTRFGRLPAIDFRDSHYRAGNLMARQMEADANGIVQRAGMGSIPTFKYYSVAEIFDQGYTSQCVSYSAGQLLEMGPVTNNVFDRTTAKLYFKQLYDECQKVDEWPGEDYDGTSVRASMKVLQSRGHISQYYWAYTVNEVAAWLLTKGPVQMGTDWHERMLDTDRDGFVSVGGSIAGGHAYIFAGVNLQRECPDGSRGAFRIVNSWGRAWGQVGRAWVSMRDTNILLENYGEAAMAEEIKGVPSIQG
jgi:C1A family cysteine protease